MRLVVCVNYRALTRVVCENVDLRLLAGVLQSGRRNVSSILRVEVRVLQDLTHATVGRYSRVVNGCRSVLADLETLLSCSATFCGLRAVCLCVCLCV